MRIMRGIAIFLLVWGVITLTINSYNAYSFRLQNATISALSERGSFTLKELEVPDFRLIVGQETFRISEDVYPMKQPGQTILGAGVYELIKLRGLDYQTHYSFVSQLVTMGSSAMLMGIASAVMYYLVAKLTGKEKLGILCSLLLVFGTIVWPYAGVTHHDILGMFLILVGLALMMRGKQGIAGIVLGLSAFFTMLTLTFPVSMWLVSRDKKRMGVGIVIGLIPTLLFNYLVFGKIWLVANLAGKVSDTVPLASLSNLLQKLWFYLASPTTSLLAFSPFLIFGVWGILELKKSNHLKKLLLVPVLAHLLYISSIETFGGHQYGPRYLLPIIPFLVVGVALWLKKKRVGWQKRVFGAAVLYSVLVAAIGAIQTVMQPLAGYAPYQLLMKVVIGELPVMRVWKYGIVITIAGLVILFGDRRREARSELKPKK